MWFFINIMLFVIAGGVLAYAVKYKNGSENYDFYNYAGVTIILCILGILSSIIKLIAGFF